MPNLSVLPLNHDSPGCNECTLRAARNPFDRAVGVPKIAVATGLVLLYVDVSLTVPVETESGSGE